MKPYYQDDLVTIYHGDALDFDFAGVADVLVTDPPYGMDLGRHGETRPSRLGRGPYLSYDDSPESYRATVVPIVTAALAATKRGAVFAPAPSAWMLPAPSALGGVFIPAANGRSPWGFQNLAPVLLYGIAPDLNLGARATVFRATGRSEVELGHPCPKPLPWMTWLVTLASKDNEIVLDPFAGSGTTLRAAKDLGRRAIGIELEERYCEVAARRCSQEVLGLAV